MARSILSQIRFATPDIRGFGDAFIRARELKKKEDALDKEVQAKAQAATLKDRRERRESDRKFKLDMLKFRQQQLEFLEEKRQFGIEHADEIRDHQRRGIQVARGGLTQLQSFKDRQQAEREMFEADLAARAVARYETAERAQGAVTTEMAEAIMAEGPAPLDADAERRAFEVRQAREWDEKAAEVRSGINAAIREGGISGVAELGEDETGPLALETKRLQLLAAEERLREPEKPLSEEERVALEQKKLALADKRHERRIAQRRELGNSVSRQAAQLYQLTQQQGGDPLQRAAFLSNRKRMLRAQVNGAFEANSIFGDEAQKILDAIDADDWQGAAAAAKVFEKGDLGAYNTRAKDIAQRVMETFHPGEDIFLNPSIAMLNKQEWNAATQAHEAWEAAQKKRGAAKVTAIGGDYAPAGQKAKNDATARIMAYDDIQAVLPALRKTPRAAFGKAAGWVANKIDMAQGIVDVLSYFGEKEDLDLPQTWKDFNVMRQRMISLGVGLARSLLYTTSGKQLSDKEKEWNLLALGDPETFGYDRYMVALEVLEAVSRGQASRAKELMRKGVFVGNRRVKPVLADLNLSKSEARSHVRQLADWGGEAHEKARAEHKRYLALRAEADALSKKHASDPSSITQADRDRMVELREALK